MRVIDDTYPKLIFSPMRIKDVVFVYRLVGGDRLAWHGRYHTHGAREYELHYFLEGQGVFLSNRSRIEIEGNRLFLTRPREFHSILTEALSRPISYYAVLFEGEEGDKADEEALRLLDHSSEAGARFLTLEARDRFLFEELHRLSRLPDDAQGRAASYQLLSLIHRWYAPRADAAAAGRTGSVHIEKALDWMARSTRAKLSVGDLAALLDLSEEHFIRIFRAELGMTPFQYFTRLKAEAASGFLASSRLPVASIAELFGFENPFHFPRVFKKCTGLSPAAYRRAYVQVADFAPQAGTQVAPQAVPRSPAE